MFIVGLDVDANAYFIVVTMIIVTYFQDATCPYLKLTSLHTLSLTYLHPYELGESKTP